MTLNLILKLIGCAILLLAAFGVRAEPGSSSAQAPYLTPIANPTAGGTIARCCW